MEKQPKKPFRLHEAGIPRTPSTEPSKPIPPSEVIKSPRPFLPPQPAKPISMRLRDIRALDDDALMKWLTTETEHPDRPLDDGTKMAITMELMKRQTRPHAPSFALLVAGVLIALASLGYTIWATQKTDNPPFAAQLPKPSPAGSTQAPAPSPPATTVAPEPNR